METWGQPTRKRGQTKRRKHRKRRPTFKVSMLKGVLAIAVLAAKLMQAVIAIIKMLRE